MKLIVPRDRGYNATVRFTLWTVLAITGAWSSGGCFVKPAPVDAESGEPSGSSSSSTSGGAEAASGSDAESSTSGSGSETTVAAQAKFGEAKFGEANFE